MQGSTTGIVSNVSDLITESLTSGSRLTLKQLELESSILLTRAQWLHLYKHLSTTKRYQRSGHLSVKYESYNLQAKKGVEIRSIQTRDFATNVTKMSYILKTKVSSITKTRYESIKYPIQISLSIEENAKSIDVPSTQKPNIVRSSTRWNFRTTEWFMSLMIVEPDIISDVSNIPRNTEVKYVLEIEKIFEGSIKTSSIPKLQKRYDVNPVVERNMAIAKQIVDSLLGVSEHMYKIAVNTNLMYTKSEVQNIHNHLVQSLPPEKSKNTYISTDVAIPTYIYNKAINLSPHNLSEDFMVKGDYRLTIKADGERKILLFLDGGIYFLSPPDRINKIAKWNNSINLSINGCVLDGELLEPSDMLTANPKRWTYMVIDCLRDENGNDVRNENKVVRMERALSLVDKINKFNIDGLDIVLKQFTPFVDTDSFYQIFDNLVIKDMIAREQMSGEAFNQEIQGLDKDSLEALLKRIRFETKLSYKSDGIILEPFNVDYFRKANKNSLSIFKWKPSEVLTVDLFYSFSTNQVFASSQGQNTELFTGTTRFPFNGKIFFPSNMKRNPIDIVMEFKIHDDEDGIGIEYYRDREDKEIANNINVARDVWNDMNNPLTLLDVTGRTTKVMRSYHNSIKRKLLDRGAGVGRNVEEGDVTERILLDIGSGKGADITKWQMSGYDIVYAMDPDPSNFRELKQRLSNRKKTMVSKDWLKTKIVPINKPVQDKAALKEQMSIGKNKKIRKINTISMFNSTTYFWKDKQTFDALIDVITDPEIVDIKNVKILVVSLDGDAVIQLMWPRLRQYIRGGISNYSNSVFSIDVNDWQTGEIQMSIDGTLVQNQSEWLPVFGNLTTALTKHDMQLEFKRTANKENFMSNDTMILSSLYSYAVYSPGNIPRPERTTGNLVLHQPIIDEDIKARLIESSKPFSNLDITRFTEEQLGRDEHQLTQLNVRVPRLKTDQKAPILANIRVVPKTHPGMLIMKQSVRNVIPVQERVGKSEAEYDDLLHLIGRYKCRLSKVDDFGEPRYVYRSGCIQTNFSLLHCILKATSDSYISNRNYLHRRCLATRLYDDLVANGLNQDIEPLSRTFDAISLKLLTDLCDLNIIVMQSRSDNTYKIVYMDNEAKDRSDRFTIIVNYNEGYELIGSRDNDDMNRILDFQSLFVNTDGLIKTLTSL